MRFRILVPLLGVFFLHGVAGAPSTATPPAASKETAGAIPAASPAELTAALKAGVPLIVEFGGEHCIPCMQMQPVLRDVQKLLGKRGRVVNFWIQSHPEVARQHRIMVMPTQVIFDAKGEELFRHMGYFPRPDFEAALKAKGLL